VRETARDHLEHLASSFVPEHPRQPGVGIWLGVNGNVTVSRHGNSFRDVTTHVFTFS
jgi:hypothetical protein